MDRVKRIWYLSPMRAAKVQASLCIRAVSPEPLLFAHTSSESRGTFRQKARSMAPLNGLACAVKICHDGMLEDTNSLDGAHMVWVFIRITILINIHNFKQFCCGYSLASPWRGDSNEYTHVLWRTEENYLLNDPQLPILSISQLS